MSKHLKYRQEILKKYQEVGGTIVEGYPRPTLGGIKDALKEIYHLRSTDNDKRFLKAFLGVNDLAIRDSDFNQLNKYKKVRRYLLKETKKPRNETIEIAAMLVNFNPRPLSKFLGEGKNSGEDHNGTEKLPSKIEEILHLLENLNKVADSINYDSLLEVFDKKAGKILQSAIHNWSEDQLRPILASVVDERIVLTERKLKKAMRINNKLGFIGAILVPTITIEQIKEEVWHEGFDRIADFLRFESSADEKGDYSIEEFEDDDDIDDIMKEII